MSLTGARAQLRLRQAKNGPMPPLWPAILPPALILASDYKLRSREAGASLSGGADLMVLVEIAIYAAAALFMYRRFGLRPPVRRTTGLLFAAWSWGGFLALSALWSPYPAISVVRAAQTLIVLSACQLLATRARTADMHRFAHLFIAIVLISVGIGVVHPFPRTNLTQDRFNWLFVHPVTAGVYLGVAVLLVTAFMIRRQPAPTRGPRRILGPWPLPVYLGSLVILAGALAATGTRGAAVGCVLGLAVLLATANGPRGRVDLLVTSVAVAIIVVLAFAQAVLSFATRGEDAEQLSSLNSRTDLWALAFKRIAEEPIFGYGLGASRGLFLRDTGLGGGHNAFVNALVDNGYVGLILFVLLLITLGTVLMALVRYREVRSDAGLLAGLTGFFVVDAITFEGLAAPANVAGVWLFLMVAWTEVLRRDAAGSTDPADRVLAADPLLDGRDGAAAAQPHHSAGRTDREQGRQ
jgi:exopolysaccharide production protein ExoQ